MFESVRGPLVQDNYSVTLVPYPTISEAPPNLWATQQQRSIPELNRLQLPLLKRPQDQPPL